MRIVAFVSFVFVLAGCDMPTPLAPAEPIGEVPKWGEAFETPTEAPASMLSGSHGAGTTTSQSPGETGDWSGGDPALGKGVYTAMCARCHGANGEGGALPGGAAVPALNDPAFQQRVSDREMARTVALGKGAMPSFMRDLDRAKLSGVIAHIRTLKR
jgi:mono/diheme cytochrome c family protein